MKRMNCILLVVLLLLVCTGAAADQHYEIQGVFEGKAGGKIVSFDLYEQEGKLITVSSLFPEFAIEQNTGTHDGILSVISRFLDIRPGEIMNAIESAERFTEEWLSLQTAEEAAGIYSGDLFENATNMKSCEFSLSEYARFLRDRFHDSEKDGTDAVFPGILFSLNNPAAGSDPVIRTGSFMDGKYFTALAMDHDEVLLTLSFDRTSDQKKRILVSFKTDGRYFFRDVGIQYDQSGMTMTSSVYIGNYSAYTMYAGYKPLFSETLRLSEDSEPDTDFEFAFDAAKLKKPLIGKGRISGTQNGNSSITAVLYVEGNETEIMNLSLWTEDIIRTVSFTDKQILHADSKEETGMISAAWFAGAMSLAGEIITALPREYQKLLTDLLIN